MGAYNRGSCRPRPVSFFLYKRDKDPRWRRGLKAWSLEEVVALTTDERIQEDHRLLNALRFLSGLRPKLGATLRFSDLDTRREPLWAISVTTAFDSRSRTEKDQTKTGAEYVVLVHPVLRRALESWLSEGWQRFTGRERRPDDLVIPNHRVRPRTAQTKREAFYGDLDRVGIPRQRLYETRATFRNLCLAGGAPRDAVNHITHPKPIQASDYYDRNNVQWPLMCRAVLCIDDRPWAGTSLGPPVRERPDSPVRGVTTDGDQSGDPSGDLYGTDQTQTPEIRTRISGAQMVTRTGFEPMFSA